MAASIRSGYVALAGRPNVGKSTLLNALLGRKLSIVTPKPQTTRQSLAGIVNREDAQIVLVDTPGLQRQARKALNRAMHRAAVASVEGADVAALVVEALRWESADEQALEILQQAGRPIVAIVNKVDRVKPRELLLPYLQQLSGKAAFEQIVPVSARRGSNLAALLGALTALLPEGPMLFPADAVTDRSEQFLAAEVVREKLMIRLREELPYGIAVGIERYEQRDHGLVIGAVIWVERPGMKAIVIGRAGSLLKEIGREARVELAERLAQPVHLELWVKVREQWSNDDRALRDLGYDS